MLFEFWRFSTWAPFLLPANWVSRIILPMYCTIPMTWPQFILDDLWLHLPHNKCWGQVAGLRPRLQNIPRVYTVPQLRARYSKSHIIQKLLILCRGDPTLYISYTRSLRWTPNWRQGLCLQALPHDPLCRARTRPSSQFQRGSCSNETPDWNDLRPTEGQIHMSAGAAGGTRQGMWHHCGMCSAPQCGYNQEGEDPSYHGPSWGWPRASPLGWADRTAARDRIAHHHFSWIFHLYG